MGTLYLIRHARPAVDGLLLGQFDPPLSEQGREDARHIATRFEVKRVYSSPLRRALQTAALLQSPAGVTVFDGLSEISLGSWDGKSWAEVERADPQLARRKSEDWFGLTPPEGEPWAAFSSRVLASFEAIRKGVLPAAIVAHLAVNSVIAERITGSAASQFQQDYCEVIELDV